MKARAAILVAALSLAGAIYADSVGFVERVGTRFEAAGQPVYYVGASYYNAMNQAADPAQRPALDAAFAQLESLGVTNVRIWASSEGAGGAGTLTPTVQPAAGIYSETMLAGLDYALRSARDHNLRVVMVLNNNWDWSGGMNQYVAWSPTTSKSLPNDQWGQGAYHDQFYTDANVQTAYRGYVSTLVNRTNTAYAPGSQPAYRDDPTIFSWELANEPRCYEPPGGQSAQTVLSNWIDSAAGYIKSIDPNHMVATGSEGFLNKPGSANWWERPQYSGTDFALNHQSSNIDYATVHIWPYNWGWYPTPDSDNLDVLYARATAFLNDHLAAAQTLGKPLVLEEFGLLRDDDHDGNGLPGGGPTTQRDELYRRYYQMLYANALAGGPAAGSNFWTWLGDPPQEPQDMNAVTSADASTLAVIAEAAALMNALVPARGDANADGLVNGGDLALWQQNYDPLGLHANTWAMGDWNGDGKIDGRDLALWRQHYYPLGAGALIGSDDLLFLAEVPEPATWTLTALAALGIISPLRRRLDSRRHGKDADVPLRRA